MWSVLHLVFWKETMIVLNISKRKKRGVKWLREESRDSYLLYFDLTERWLEMAVIFESILWAALSWKLTLCYLLEVFNRNYSIVIYPFGKLFNKTTLSHQSSFYRNYPIELLKYKKWLRTKIKILISLLSFIIVYNATFVILLCEAA